MNLNNSLKSNIIFPALLMIVFISLSFPFLVSGLVCEEEECNRAGGTCGFDDSLQRNWVCKKSGSKTGSGGTSVRGITGGETIQIANPLVAKTIPDLIDRITNFLVYIATPIVVLMMFWGAFQIMTAGGEPEKALTGRRTITYTVVGYILLLVAKGITAIIADVLGVK